MENLNARKINRILSNTNFINEKTIEKLSEKISCYKFLKLGSYKF